MSAYAYVICQWPLLEFSSFVSSLIDKIESVQRYLLRLFGLSELSYCERPISLEYGRPVYNLQCRFCCTMLYGLWYISAC